MPSFAEIKNDSAIKAYITAADSSLAALGYTEHSFAHVTKVAESAADILSALGYDDHTVELARIAGYLHDIGNLVNRNEHSQSGAVMAFRILDRLGFEPEAVLAILAYCSERGKKTMRYAEKLAISFYDEDITTSDAVYDKIRKIEKSALVTEQIKKLFGVGERALSSTEKKLFERWTSDYGYDIEIIRRAYDITIDNAHEPEPKYTNGVLTKWYEAGIRTLDEIDKYEEQRRVDYTAAQPKTSRPRKRNESERERATTSTPSSTVSWSWLKRPTCAPTASISCRPC